MRRHITAVSLIAIVAACSQEGVSDAAESSHAEYSGSTVAELSRGSAAPTADAAADALYLGNSGAGRIQFGETQTDGAAQIFNDVTIETEDGETLSAGSIRLVGAELAGDAPTFDALQISNLSITDEDGALSVANIELIEPNTAVAALVAKIFSGEDFDEDEVDFGKFTDYAFGRFAIDGMAFTAAEGEHVSFSTLSFNGFSAGKVDGFAFEDVSFAGETEDGGEVTIALGSWIMNGLDLSGADAFAALDKYADPEDFQAALAASGLSDPFVQHYTDYEMLDFAMNVDGIRVAVDELSGSSQDTRGGLLTIDEMRPLRISFDDSGTLGAQAKEGVALLGYDSFEISMTSAIVADYVNDRLYTQDYQLEVKDAFSLDIDYDIGGVREYIKNANKLSAQASSQFDPEMMSALLEPLIVNKLEVRLTDNSIVERSLKAAATMNGTTPDEMRNNVVAMMTVGSMMAPQGPAQEFVREAITAATAFLGDPGELRIAVESDTPLALSDVVDALESEDPTSALALADVTFEASGK